MGLQKDTFWCDIEEMSSDTLMLVMICMMISLLNMVSINLPKQINPLISETASFLTVSPLYMHFVMTTLLKISGPPIVI